VTNVVPGMAIEHSGQPTGHVPELILNRFNTRLGHRIGRFLGSFFPHAPEFQGRQVGHADEMEKESGDKDSDHTMNHWREFCGL
jgi:rRNA maturation protein Rpf1